MLYALRHLITIIGTLDIKIAYIEYPGPASVSLNTFPEWIIIIAEIPLRMKHVTMPLLLEKMTRACLESQNLFPVKTENFISALMIARLKQNIIIRVNLVELLKLSGEKNYKLSKCF